MNDLTIYLDSIPAN